MLMISTGLVSLLLATLQQWQLRKKLMGDTIQLFRRGIIFPTVSRAVPLFDKDQTFVGPTVTQPVTPLFKVHEAVRIAKADERIARAKANAASVQLTADVERAYFDLLIAQRRHVEARANVEIAERKLQLASAAAAPVDGMTDRETALLGTVPTQRHECDGATKRGTLIWRAAPLVAKVARPDQAG